MSRQIPFTRCLALATLLVATGATSSVRAQAAPAQAGPDAASVAPVAPSVPAPAPAPASTLMVPVEPAKGPDRGAVNAGGGWASLMDAVPVHGPWALGAIFWGQAVSCSGGDDLARRQCEGVRDARRKAYMGRVFKVAADSSAIEVGAFNAKKKTVAIKLRGCVSCIKPIELDGGARFVVTKGGVTVQSGIVRGPVIGQVSKSFSDAAAAEHFRDKVVPRMRAELYFTLPQSPARFSQGTAEGVQVELVGYRLVDPCQGVVLAANPALDKVPPDASTCVGDPAEALADGSAAALAPSAGLGTPALPVGPLLPAQLSNRDIKDTMAPVRTKVNACYGTYNVPGTARVSFEIAGDGMVKKLSLGGDFKDTPTGDCILEAVKSVTFPPFSGGDMPVTYPFILR